MTATSIYAEPDYAALTPAASKPALQVLRLLDPVAAEIHADEPAEELFALAIATIDRTIDAESPDEAESTRYFLTGRIDWNAIPGNDLSTLGASA